MPPLDALRGLDTPAVLVDLDVVASNIAAMQAIARRAGVALRPHAKTHKSVRIARRQLEAGASGITVAKVAEAEAFRGAGISDIFIAYPIVGEVKLARLAPLVADGEIVLAADSVEVAAGYSSLAVRVGRTIPVLLEIDSGMHRVGVEARAAGEAGVGIARLPGLELRGIMTHAGHAHDVATESDVAAIARDEIRSLQAARDALELAGIEIAVVSAGSTITAPYLSASDGVTEVRPGTYVYNDFRTLELFACTPSQMAASMLVTVVSRGPGRAVVDAGNKTLTLTRTEQHGYGRLRGRPRSRFTRLSEEHGVIELAPEDEDLQVGDLAEVLPVHVCAWMDLQREVYGTLDGNVGEVIPVEAMRSSR